MKVVRSALRTGRLYPPPQEIFLVLILRTAVADLFLGDRLTDSFPDLS
jgi:hypothetical protein